MTRRLKYGGAQSENTLENKMKKLQLEDGHDYGTGPNGEKICRGARMGRADTLPNDSQTPRKLRMERLRMSADGCYDQGGAYWGVANPLYCAHAEGVRVFVRGDSRARAKEVVRGMLPGVRFYR